MSNLIKPKDYTKVGEITIVVFKDGRCPMDTQGLTTSGLIKVLASEILYIGINDVRRHGGQDEFIRLKAHCVGLNLLARELAEKEKANELPLIMQPDVKRREDEPS